MPYTVKDHLNPTAHELEMNKKVLWELTKGLEVSSYLGMNEIVALAYVALREKNNQYDDDLYEDVCLNYSFIAGLKKEELQDVSGSIDESDLKTIILNAEYLSTNSRFHESFSTPESIIKLGLSILDIKDKERVVDLCCGGGKFLITAASDNPKAFYSGVDINASAILTSRIRKVVFGEEISFTLNNSFNYVKESPLFDKVFSNYPFGLRIKSLGKGFYYSEELQERIPELTKATSSDWVFNSSAIDALKEGGIAVCVMTNGATSNTIDRAIRKYFVESGYIKAVIALPPRMFDDTGIPTTMIVFEKKKNGSIMFVDTEKMCQKGRRTNFFSEDDIKKIMHSLKEDTDYSRKVPLKEVLGQQFNLTPLRYLKSYIEMISVKDGVEFGSVMKKITRGASIKASDLDELTSVEETDYQYLMISNVKDGVIQKDLPYLDHIDDNLTKYCIKEGDLIFSKNGYPYKVAVAGKSDKQILANGNLFVIEVDTEKANPYYIKALFESEKGIALLKSITVGATIPNFGASQLKSLVIPLPPIEKQNKIAEELLKVDDEISVLRSRIIKAQVRKNMLFEEISEGADIE